MIIPQGKEWMLYVTSFLMAIYNHTIRCLTDSDPPECIIEESRLERAELMFINMESDDEVGL